jgi:ABC-type Fe3+/spermidine/putrescine transport system ATPase subunit/ABC-type sulfate transport system permease component
VSGRRARSPLVWLGGLIVVYLALPLTAYAVRLAASRQRGFHTPGLLPALWVSISCATISLVLLTLFGVPLAYLLARSHGRVASIVGMIVQIPLALPPVMSGILLIYLVGPYTFIGRLFGERLTNSATGIVLAMTFCSAPFLIVAARASFVTIDQGLLDVAATLGHSETSRFLRVAVPMAAPGIRAGMLLAWLRAFGEYGAVVILAYNPTSLPIYTYSQFSGRGLPTTLAPTALALFAAVIAVMVSRVRVSRPRWGRTSVPAPTPPTPATPRPVRFTVSHRLGSFHLELAQESSTRHLAILGPSGSGKSALLRCLAGLYGAAPGPVWYGEQSVQDVPVEHRRVGYVAQRFSLYPHLTVWQHLLFARGASAELAAYWLERLHLGGLENRYPSELSGGQQQRVGLAQALCGSPQVLLLDEPFSALDVPVRLELRRELRRLQRETGLTTVIVTHDPEEAAFLSDEVIVIADGQPLQSGTSRHVFSRPASPEVAKLLGIANLQHATVISSRQIDANGALIEVSITDLVAGTPVWWSIRPERVLITGARGADARAHDAPRSLPGRLNDIADVGTALDLFVAIAPEIEVQARTAELIDLQVGDRCRITLPPEAISIWSVSTQLSPVGHDLLHVDP